MEQVSTVERARRVSAARQAHQMWSPSGPGWQTPGFTAPLGWPVKQVLLYPWPGPSGPPSGICHRSTTGCLFPGCRHPVYLQAEVQLPELPGGFTSDLRWHAWSPSAFIVRPQAQPLHSTSLLHMAQHAAASFVQVALSSGDCARQTLWKSSPSHVSCGPGGGGGPVEHEPTTIDQSVAFKTDLPRLLARESPTEGAQR